MQPPQNQPQQPQQQPQYPTQPTPYPPPAQYPPYPQYAPPPQYPQYPPQYSQPLQPPVDMNIHHSFAPRTYYNLDFTGNAWVCVGLYTAFWIPGLVMSFVYLMQARRVQRETGQQVFGMGCLWTTLILGIIPVALVLFIVGISLLLGIIATLANPS